MEYLVCPISCGELSKKKKKKKKSLVKKISKKNYSREGFCTWIDQGVSKLR